MLYADQNRPISQVITSQNKVDHSRTPSDFMLTSFRRQIWVEIKWLEKVDSRLVLRFYVRFQVKNESNVSEYSGILFRKVKFRRSWITISSL